MPSSREAELAGRWGARSPSALEPRAGVRPGDCSSCFLGSRGRTEVSGLLGGTD